MAGEDADGGTYTLVIALESPATAAVGALGTVAFPAGGYAYVGSALGPGGFTRVDRHRDVAAGERAVRHWHVDYLLGLPGATVEETVRSPGLGAECAVAAATAGDPVAGFGATDCGCGSHLSYHPAVGRARRAARAAHRVVAERRADG